MVITSKGRGRPHGRWRRQRRAGREKKRKCIRRKEWLLFSLLFAIRIACAQKLCHHSENFDVHGKNGVSKTIECCLFARALYKMTRGWFVFCDNRLRNGIDVCQPLTMSPLRIYNQPLIYRFNFTGMAQKRRKQQNKTQHVHLTTYVVSYYKNKHFIRKLVCSNGIFCCQSSLNFRKSWLKLSDKI